MAKGRFRFLRQLRSKPHCVSPVLPDRQPDRRPARVFAPPPQFPDYRPFWEGRQGSGPALPPLTGILRPQRDVTRLTPPASHGNFGMLSSFPFFVAEPTNPAPPKEFAVVPESPLETTITPRYTVPIEKALQTPLALSLTSASSPLTLDSTTAVRSEPSLSDVHCTWLWIAVASQLPRATAIPVSKAAGFSMAADVIPIGYSSASNYPPPVETASPVTSPLPFLLLSRPSSMDAPVMPFWSTTRPLSREAYRLPTAASQQESDQSVAYLHPSLPSPMSLVTWSQSLAISIPARNPSNLGGPAAAWFECESRPYAVGSTVVRERSRTPAHPVAAATDRNEMDASGTGASRPAAPSHQTDSPGQSGNGPALSGRGPCTTGLHAHAPAGCSAC